MSLCLIINLSLPQAHAGENSPLQQQTILVVGDSISAGFGIDKDLGWVALLGQRLESKFTQYALVNASISGETTGGALRRLDALLEQYQPTHVLIELGANDGLRGFPITKMQTNLTALIEKSQAADAQTALMEIYIPPNYGPRYSKMFTDSFTSVSEATNSHLMPFFVLKVAGKNELMQNDNLHPNKTAQPILRDEMYNTINQWLNKE